MAEKPDKIYNRVQIILLMFSRLIFAFKTKRNGSEIYLLYARDNINSSVFSILFNSIISDHTTSRSSFKRNREIVNKIVILILLKTTGLKS